ncbi:hypothetical protein Fmac_010172 [Flemingia macrophylla]|uniref:Uncharacterized protein n=1 Tax=Flemingia macrophylla TaxID=520843 RepID=A0ABD1N2C6_9FABA
MLWSCFPDPTQKLLQSLPACFLLAHRFLKLLSLPCGVVRIDERKEEFYLFLFFYI